MPPLLMLLNVKKFRAFLKSSKPISPPTVPVGGLVKPNIFNGNTETLFNVDANELIETGAYYIATSIENAMMYSYLIVFRMTDNTIIQINTSNAGEISAGIYAIKIRGKHEGKDWSIWRQISLTPL